MLVKLGEQNLCVGLLSPENVRNPISRELLKYKSEGKSSSVSTSTPLDSYSSPLVAADFEMELGLRNSIKLCNN
ncbi:hypothetical protein CEXT_516301 [Caerostris extrusa]|uniref:Uncharacterized protein n=1 Tax=Caerostris extrusa TaxID=172846 RepID=A0AAV4NAB3_CAEEX|nr:hypothetical protein CEXT_516301 [Caerostris extrusa]